MQRVLVSILNYNSYQDTIKAVLCYQVQSYPHVDIQIVDNASSDRSVERIIKRFPDIPVIPLGHNGGYAGGNNVALEMAVNGGYDYVVISNADVVVDAECLTHLVDTACAYPDCGMVGGVEIDFKTGRVISAGGFGYNKWLSRGRWLSGVSLDCSCPSRVDYVQGSVCLFSRQALLRGIRFDSNLFMYLEEIDVGLQLRKAKLAAYLNPLCKILHKRSAGRFNPMAGYFIQRNRLYMARKCSPFYVFACNAIFTCIFELSAKIVIRSFQGRFRFIRACIAGYVDGIRGNMAQGRGLLV